MMVQLKVGYLPHFSVVREDKETTKGRRVFDSVTRHCRISLNDTMLPGPLLHQDVFDVLLRFRSDPVALVAVLTEIFSQVTMAKQYRQYYRFLWRGLVLLRRPLKVSKAIRLMFGDRISLYLTQSVVRKRAEDNRNDYPVVTVVAMIPDKCAWITMTSLETKDEARDRLRELLGKAGFKIRRLLWTFIWGRSTLYQNGAS